LVVHHYGKPDKDGRADSHQTRGASSIKDWCDTLLGVSRQKGEQILRKLEFIKVRNGPEPKPVTLERDKDSFIHRVIEDDDLCLPGKVRTILESLGGEIKGQGDLIKAIMEDTGCKDRRARHFIKQALEQYAILQRDDEKDKRMKIYFVNT
jgi:hypothetical protein